MIKRGDIFYADLNPIVGSEQGGIRPVLVIQNDIGNKYSLTIIAVPISSAKKQFLPVHIMLSGTGVLPKSSVILTEQIRTLDRRRLCEYVGSLDCSIMKKVDEALKISMGV